MPRGRCAGCGEEDFLPPFGEGMCFLCATDGPPGDRSSAIGAVAEGDDARREAWPSDRDIERHDEVTGLFEEQQTRFARAIGSAHYRAQRFTTWVRPKRYERPRDEGPVGPTPEQLKARVERQRRLQARIAAPLVHAARIQATRERRRGGGNYAPTERVAQAQRLRAAGMSLRAIAKVTGMHRDTIMRYVAWVDRSEAMRRTHERWKAEGRRVVPPWVRSTTG